MRMKSEQRIPTGVLCLWEGEDVKLEFISKASQSTKMVMPKRTWRKLAGHNQVFCFGMIAACLLIWGARLLSQLF